MTKIERVYVLKLHESRYVVNITSDAVSFAKHPAQAKWFETPEAAAATLSGVEIVEFEMSTTEAR